MKKNESLSFKFSSEDYLFGKPVGNFRLPCGSLSCGEAEARKLITQLGLCNRPDARILELERRSRVASVWGFRRDREAYDCLRETGFRLKGLNHIPRNIPNCSFDYQLSLFDALE